VSFESYDYLGEKDVFAVPLFDVDADGSSVETVKVSEEEEARAKRLHEQSIVIDFHCHPHRLPVKCEEDFEAYARSGRIAYSFAGIKLSGLTACFNGYGGSAGRRSSPRPWQFDDIIWDIGMRQADIDHHPDVTMRGLCTADILKAKEKGCCAVFAGVENAGIIDTDLDRIDVLYGLGVRCLGLSYNHRNTIADGGEETQDGGLSKFGYRVVERMNRLGILMDLSHSSNQTILDAIEVSEKPCCLSHTVSGYVCDHPKGKSDELFKLMAEKDWVIGVESVPNVTSLEVEQSIYDVADNIDHLVEVMGIDHVAVGTDSMFGDHVALHRVIHKLLGHPDAPMPGKRVRYLEDISQFPNVTRVLVERGYSDDEIGKLLGGNIFALLQKTID